MGLEGSIALNFWHLRWGKEANILLIIILLGSVGRKYFVNYYILGSEGSFVFNFGS